MYAYFGMSFAEFQGIIMYEKSKKKKNGPSIYNDRDRDDIV